MIETKIKRYLIQLIVMLGILIGNDQVSACETASVAPHQDERQSGVNVQYTQALPASQLKLVNTPKQTHSGQGAKMYEFYPAADFTVALLAGRVPHVPSRLPRVAIEKNQPRF